MELTKFLGYFSTVLLIINTVLYIKALHKSKAFMFFAFFLIISTIVQVSMSILGAILHLSNLYMVNVFLMLQFLLLSFFFKSLLKKNIILVFTALIIALLAYQYLQDPELFFRYNPIGIGITHSMLVIYAISYLYQVLQKQKPKFLYVTIGLFLYLICNTLILVSGNLVFNINISQEVYAILFRVNAVLYIIFQILIFIEWRKNYYKKIHKSL